MKKQSATPTKPAGRQPVIAGRVPRSLHERIKRAAKASGRSMSEELAWRASMSFEWEAAFASMRKSLAEIEQGSVDAALIRKGYTCQRDAATGKKVWAEPGYPGTEPGTEHLRSGFITPPDEDQ
jgi:Arc-like DNA binding domain